MGSAAVHTYLRPLGTSQGPVTCPKLWQPGCSELEAAGREGDGTGNAI